MTKKSAQLDTSKHPPLFVFGLDSEGKPRGAKFKEIKDDIASAAMDKKYVVVGLPPAALRELAVKLPLGRLFSNGKLIVPAIRKDLYDKLVVACRENEKQQTAKPRPSSTDTNLADGFKVRNGLPSSWEVTGEGDMILIEESADDGWFEAICVKRDGDILTLRYRDYAGSPTFIRHISAIARVYPGPF